mmetsp:Transcript_7062/g.10432  ORF Transcript_7062/g.10432 Transcript_7062/m.10432 type:complete len:135 (-) Transcript_7062:1177-1581(-)
MTIIWHMRHNSLDEDEAYGGGDGQLFSSPLCDGVGAELFGCVETLPIIQPFKNFARAYGLKFCSNCIAAEDLQTNFINIVFVNKDKVLNMVSAYHAAGNNIDAWTVKNHMMRIEDYLWLVDDGLKIQGYNRSQC